MPRRITIQTGNGLDTRPREFSEINRTIIEFPSAIIATDKQIEEMRRSNVGLLDDSRSLDELRDGNLFCR